MKIIHTSDWHLGHRLYNYDRSDEEAVFFEQLGNTVAQEQPDAMLVCGDIFHTGVPGNDVARDFTERLLEVQSRCPTMETVVIAGNHDSYSRLVIDQQLWERCHVHVFGVPAEDETGCADFASIIIRVGDKGVIAAVPYCHSRNFPIIQGTPEGTDRQKSYFAALSKYVKDQAGDLPSVLMAHLAVKGELDLRGHDASLIVGGEECVNGDELGATYDYIALGHIHCPQWIKGARQVARYCGTPRPIHFDETYPHGVDVVTIEHGKDPVVRSQAFEPLHPLVTFGGESGKEFDEVLEELAGMTLAGGTYVRLNVRLEGDALLNPEWQEKARQACAARSLRFCVINPVREDVSEEQSTKRHRLTTEELKELSDDEVLQILMTQHPLSERQCELVKELMKEVAE